MNKKKNNNGKYIGFGRVLVLVFVFDIQSRISQSVHHYQMRITHQTLMLTLPNGVNSLSAPPPAFTDASAQGSPNVAV